MSKSGTSKHTTRSVVSADQSQTVNDDYSPREFRYWRNLFIYFWVFGIFGIALEAVWSFIRFNITGQSGFHPIAPTITPLSPPYGLGAVALAALVYPIVHRSKRMNVLTVYIVSVAILTAIELTCALLIILVLGNNPFWSYSREPYNFYGLIELKNSLLFGIVGVVFIYFIFPRVKKILRRISDKLLNEIFWFTFVTYTCDVAFAIYNILGNHIKL